jgi:hypothetical protein
VTKFSKTYQPKNKGRPLAVVSEKTVEDMASWDFTVEEIAAQTGVCEDTIRARFSAALKRGRDHGKGSLKHRLFMKAMDGDISALIWLSKNRLGYRDKQPDEATQVHFNVMVNEVPK